MGNKSACAIFGTFICRFDISTGLSELNVPLLVIFTTYTFVEKSNSPKYIMRPSLVFFFKNAEKITSA